MSVDRGPLVQLFLLVPDARLKEYVERGIGREPTPKEMRTFKSGSAVAPDTFGVTPPAAPALPKMFDRLDGYGLDRDSYFIDHLTRREPRMTPEEFEKYLDRLDNMSQADRLARLCNLMKAAGPEVCREAFRRAYFGKKDGDNG